MTAKRIQAGGASATTPSATSQVSDLQHAQVAHGGAFPTYRRNRAQAHTHTQQPIWEDAPNTPPARASKIESKIPAWLRRHLAETGVMVQGFTRRARVVSCFKCGQPVVKGWTDEPCSILATCDLGALSNLGEAMALMQGRTTFDLAYRGGRLELDIRDQDEIHGSPAEDPGWYRAKADVLATHACNTGPLPTIESRIP